MNLLFKDIYGKEFSLGTYSFDILNKRDIFDEDSINSDYFSDIIVELNSDGCKNVSNKINNLINTDLYIKEIIRKDLLEKIIAFSVFLKRCKYVKAKIA